jgi:PKD repeat protein
MRSIGLMAVVTGMLALASACSEGAGIDPPENTPPTAGFTHTCNALDCSFTSTSTDVAPGTIATYAWTFGDGGTSPANAPTHTYTASASTDFTVTLTVTDNEGATDVETQTVTVVPPAPVNAPPTAGFDHTCDAANCSFVSTSTDVAPGTIATYAWTFGDGAVSDLANPSHAYTITAATDFTVTLTVTDNGGASDIETQTFTVVPPPVNTPPTAGFSYVCETASCRFTSTSTDVAPGVIATYEWAFGDGATANVSNPSHIYAVIAPTDFTVTLTVTDDEGANDVETQVVHVVPPPPGVEGCTTTLTRVECVLDIPVQATIKLKLNEINCDIQGNRVTIPPPIGDQVFLNVCFKTPGLELGIFGGPADSLIVFPAGSQARIWINQGTANKGDPALGPPVGNLVGTFPDWTINFEDGDNPGGEGEPDFTDIVLGVRATVRP